VSRELLHKFELELRRCSEIEDIAPLPFIVSLATDVGVPADQMSFALKYAHDIGLITFPMLIGKNTKPLGTSCLLISSLFCFRVSPLICLLQAVLQVLRPPR